MCSFFFFSSRRRHTRYWRDWSSDVCSSDLRVPAHALYRAQTQRAVENFPLSGQRLERAHIRALAQIKAAAAAVNADLGVLDKPRADAIIEAATEVADGKHDEHFPDRTSVV